MVLATGRVTFGLAVVMVVIFDFAAEAAVPDVAELLPVVVGTFAALALVTLAGGDASGSMLTSDRNEFAARKASDLC